MCHVFQNYENHCNFENPCTNENSYSFEPFESFKTMLHANKLNKKVWHQRLQHPNSHIFRKNIKDMIVELNHKDTKFSLFCFFFESCQFGKHKQSTFPLSQSKVEAPLELIHHDEWGLAPVMLNEESKYCIHFLDDFSRFTWNFPLKTKSDFLVKFHKLVESQFDGRVKMFHSDWGGVYKFHSLFKRKWLRF